MRERIQKETPEGLSKVAEVLLENHDEAKKRITECGTTLWAGYHPYARAALVGGVTGVVLTLYAVLGDISLLDLVGIANAHADVTAAAADDQRSLVGGGGLAAMDFTRAMGFGGGGWRDF